MTNSTASVRTNRFTYDFINRTINGSKASFDKASKGYGEIYEDLARMMANQPTFTFNIVEPKKPATAKRTYNGLNKQFITEYISIQVEAQLLAKERAEVEKWAEDTGRKVFPVVKKWFLDKFSTEEEPFDMEKAKEDIFNAMASKANQTALHLIQKEAENNITPMPTAAQAS